MIRCNYGLLQRNCKGTKWMAVLAEYSVETASTHGNS